MKKKSLPLSRVYQLLEPGPVVMVSTSYHGKPNVMTMAWHMMVDFVPPLVACVIGAGDYTFDIIKETKECVINIPSVELAPTVVKVGKTTGAEIDKFHKFNLTAVEAEIVQAPLIDECFANLECKVIDTRFMEQYDIFILEVVKAWIATSKKRYRTIHHCGNGVFVVDGKIIKLPFRSIS